MHGYLRDITEKVFVEEKEREAPQREFATKTSDVAGEESCEFLRNGLLKTGKEGKAMQRPGMED